jgi:hypothetical protein
MPTLGYQMFIRSSSWLCNLYAKRFGHATVAILRKRPNLSDLQVAESLIDYFEPDPLDIDDPLTTTMNWNTTIVRWQDGRRDDMYLHEARLRFRGTPELWRLVAQEQHKFVTRVSFTTKYARLRAFRLDRDVEQFRADVLSDIEQARLHAAAQEISIDRYRSMMVQAADHFYGHVAIGGLRTYAAELKEQDDRTNAALFGG